MWTFIFIKLRFQIDLKGPILGKIHSSSYNNIPESQKFHPFFMFFLGPFQFAVDAVLEIHDVLWWPLPGSYFVLSS